MSPFININYYKYGIKHNYMNKYNLIDKIHTDIDKEYFYKIRIKSNNYYFFDIRCIHKLFINIPSGI